MAGWFNTAVPTGMAHIIEKSSPLKALSNGMSELVDIVDNRAKEKYTTTALEQLKGAKSMQDVMNLGLDTSKMTKAGYNQYTNNINMMSKIAEENRANERLNLAIAEDKRSAMRLADEQAKTYMQQATNEAAGDRLTMSDKDWQAKWGNAGGINKLTVENALMKKQENDRANEIFAFNKKVDQLTFASNSVSKQISALEPAYKTAVSVYQAGSASPEQKAAARKTILEYESLVGKYKNINAEANRLFGSDGGKISIAGNTQQTGGVDALNDNRYNNGSVTSEPSIFNSISQNNTTNQVNTQTPTTTVPTDGTKTTDKINLGSIKKVDSNVNQPNLYTADSINDLYLKTKKQYETYSNSGNSVDEKAAKAMKPQLDNLQTLSLFGQGELGFTKAMEKFYMSGASGLQISDSRAKDLVRKDVGEIYNAFTNAMSDEGIGSIWSNEFADQSTEEQRDMFFNKVLPGLVGYIYENNAKQGKGVPNTQQIVEELKGYTSDEGIFRMPFTTDDKTYSNISPIRSFIRENANELKKYNAKIEADVVSKQKEQRKQSFRNKRKIDDSQIRIIDKALKNNEISTLDYVLFSVFGTEPSNTDIKKQFEDVRNKWK